MSNPFAALPAVHRVLASREVADAGACYGAAVARQAARDVLAAVRARVAHGDPVPALEALTSEVRSLLERRAAVAYPEVLNATGVLIHTNLGRSPQLAVSAPGYVALEYDLTSGERGERLTPVTARLVRYFGGESATVVTNNAAALVLLLAAHAAGREVIVSRGELIEIGGAFRLPDIMAASGARLVEVGCTNRTHPDDFARAIGDNTASILVVHRSNFALAGFVATPELKDLVDLGRRRGTPVWVDQGSGCHLDLTRYDLRHETTVQQILADGVDAVLFSGDKLLGGPQAGIVVGTHSAIAGMRHHPLRRAVRPDKNSLAVLAATLDAYLAGRPEEIPLYRLLAAPASTIRSRARRIARRLQLDRIEAGFRPSRAVIGGGTTPDQTVPSWAVTIPGGEDAADRLRRARPAVIGRVEEDLVVLDLKAIFAEQDAMLARSVATALAG